MNDGLDPAYLQARMLLVVVVLLGPMHHRLGAGRDTTLHALFSQKAISCSLVTLIGDNHYPARSRDTALHKLPLLCSLLRATIGSLLGI